MSRPIDLAVPVFCSRPRPRCGPLARDCRRVRRLRVPDLQAGRARGQAHARAVRPAHPLRVPPLPGRIGASACHARRASRRGSRRTRQVLADARSAVREPASSQDRQPARICAAPGPGHAALHRGDGRRNLFAARARAHGGRHPQPRARHADVLHQRRHSGRLLRHARADGRRGGSARQRSTR